MNLLFIQSLGIALGRGVDNGEKEVHHHDQENITQTLAVEGLPPALMQNFYLVARQHETFTLGN